MHSPVIPTPWWVNLLILVPVCLYLVLRKKKTAIGRKQLLIAALFAIAFGFVEAAVVVYLRAATGLWPGPPSKVLGQLPRELLNIERYREAATIIMLVTIAALVGQRVWQKAIVFLWAFAFWDIFYYVWLRVTIGWPGSLSDPDVLFLIPVPWLAQVWFPILVSALTAVVIWIRS